MKVTEHPGGLKALSIDQRPDTVLLRPKNHPPFEVEFAVLRAIIAEHEQDVEL